MRAFQGSRRGRAPLAAKCNLRHLCPMLSPRPFSSSAHSTQRVTIALCTYNGADHLEAQLASYLAQTHTAWDLWISDDGSTDATLDIIHAFAAAHGALHDVRILTGPRDGVAANFIQLLCHPDLPSHPVALSDQDDVWLPEKLALALVEMTEEGPLLYGAQSISVDAALRPIGRSIGGGTPSFGNALVQNIVSGHSLMLNPAALKVVRTAGVPQNIPYHDWWLYQLITGTGGKVVVRADTVLLYRQHTGNVMGSHQGVRAMLTRITQVFGRTFGEWIVQNTQNLRMLETNLTPDTALTLAALYAAPPRIGYARLAVFRRHNITRQGRLGTIALYLAVLLGRV